MSPQLRCVGLWLRGYCAELKREHACLGCRAVCLFRGYSAIWLIKDVFDGFRDLFRKFCDTSIFRLFTTVSTFSIVKLALSEFSETFHRLKIDEFECSAFSLRVAETEDYALV